MAWQEPQTSGAGVGVGVGEGVVPRAVAIAWTCVLVSVMDLIWLTPEMAELIVPADDPRTLLEASAPWHELQ